MTVAAPRLHEAWPKRTLQKVQEWEEPSRPPARHPASGA